MVCLGKALIRLRDHIHEGESHLQDILFCIGTNYFIMEFVILPAIKLTDFACAVAHCKSL